MTMHEISKFTMRQTKVTAPALTRSKCSEKQAVTRSREITLKDKRSTKLFLRMQPEMVLRRFFFQPAQIETNVLQACLHYFCMLFK
jgi:hypothetical protein